MSQIIQNLWLLSIHKNTEALITSSIPCSSLSPFPSSLFPLLLFSACFFFFLSAFHSLKWRHRVTWRRRNEMCYLRTVANGDKWLGVREEKRRRVKYRRAPICCWGSVLLCTDWKDGKGWTWNETSVCLFIKEIFSLSNVVNSYVIQ